jgi:NhaA family Na+:H+ antiporter
LVKQQVRAFFRHEAAGGLVLMAAAVAALLVRNSPLAGGYDAFLNLPVAIQAGSLQIAKPLLLWVNDGLMAVFFFLVGLEIKRELLEGGLSSPARAAMPVAAALGGMAAPAAIYLFANAGNPAAANGWAIPTATDIAFALGVLILLGKRVPLSLKVFLTAVAIIDDLGAIVIIALFYTDNLSIAMIGLASAGIAVLAALNRADVTRIGAYVLVGIFLWVCVLKSGVHATLAGVVCALAIPLKTRNAGVGSPLLRMEHALQPWVAFGVLPLFAFCNAGVPLAGVTVDALFSGIPVGIALGLLVGKPLGICLVCWLMTLPGWGALPEGASRLQFFAVALLCGIGFTMSLFIGSLAFDDADPGAMTMVRLGVLGGSVVAGLAGYLVMRAATARPGG